jgi:hypothetical protein
MLLRLLQILIRTQAIIVTYNTDSKCVYVTNNICLSQNQPTRVVLIITSLCDAYHSPCFAPAVDCASMIDGKAEGDCAKKLTLKDADPQ